MEVLDFFEGLAYFHRRGLCDAESLWHFFASWLLPYFAASHAVVKHMTQNDPSLFEDLARLNKELKKVESRRHPSQSSSHILSPDSIKGFLQAESQECLTIEYGLPKKDKKPD